MMVSLALGGVCPFAVYAAEEGGNTCVTSKCHATLLSHKDVHPPTDGCDSCHDAVEPDHPRKGKKTFKLADKVPALCYTCHDEYGEKPVVHPPVSDGDCTSCHDSHASDEPKLLVESQKTLCETCHDAINVKEPHGPVSTGDCVACHNPHESDHKKLLVAEGRSLCFNCHDELQNVEKRKVQHPPMEDGCTSCHAPHGTDYPMLLSAAGPESCYECHDGIQEKVDSAPVVHEPIKKKGCVVCHDPHGSDNDGLLVKSPQETCVSCHDNIAATKLKFRHGKNNEGKCSDCHDPHGGRFGKLLVAPFEMDTYVPYTGTQFALCFECHKRDMLQYPDTSFATNFRDGEKNLHYAHVNNKTKGRNCLLCHSQHGSNNPVLIAETVPFGKWQMPLKFQKTEDGGSCSPGCHKPLWYDRKHPGRRPAGLKRETVN